jgi:hypothetical protein
MQLAGLKFLQNSWKKRPIADQKPCQLIVVVSLLLLWWVRKGQFVKVLAFAGCWSLIIWQGEE